jgi:hypothetical protein
MRLLRLDPSGKLVSTDFHGKTIPPYAILSHRWGEGEVLFEDVENGAYKEKHGFRKIEFCAKRAAEDHLQYFWSDTCCIDKWNTLELSKSINSMYCWYKAAEKCYVYFSDVSVAHTTEAKRLGGRLPGKRLVQARLDTSRAHRTGIGRVLYLRRTAIR